jgi:hypothetical protein
MTTAKDFSEFSRRELMEYIATLGEIQGNNSRRILDKIEELSGRIDDLVAAMAFAAEDSTHKQEVIELPWVSVSGAGITGSKTFTPTLQNMKRGCSKDCMCRKHDDHREPIRYA